MSLTMNNFILLKTCFLFLPKDYRKESKWRGRYRQTLDLFRAKISRKKIRIIQKGRYFDRGHRYIKVFGNDRTYKDYNITC